MVRLVWPGWWLGLLVGAGVPSAAQTDLPVRDLPVQNPKLPKLPAREVDLKPRVELKENYPNPFFPATTIPFTLSQEMCVRGHQPVVSLKVYNVLVQVVAVLMDRVRLPCGERWAYWDGKYRDGTQVRTPGVYYYQLTVDGERSTRKMIAQQTVTSQH